MFLNDTIVAIATGMNNSGIGIIRISGNDSFLIASKIFRTKSCNSLSDFISHKVYYGYIYDNDQLIDEVLLISMKSPKSYTMEDTIEINCHGGNIVMRKILSCVVKYGARIADPGEFTKRAFLNGRIDLSEAEAVIDIINSQNDYSLNNSLKQLKGNLFEKIRLLRDKLVYEIAYIESALDDPEHISLDNYYDRLKPIIDNIENELKELFNSFKSGKIIKEGINTVIIGKPNVGKSSLLNVLYGSERAIVTEIAGTTRDVIEESISIKGLQLNIVDTAGIRDTDDIVESIGVKKAYDYADNADLVLLIIDGTQEINAEDILLLNYIKDKKSIILVNKSDIFDNFDINKIKSYCNKDILFISAKNEDGIDEFISVLENMFISGDIKYNDEIVLTNERHVSLINSCILSINNIKDGINTYMPEDLVVIDMVNAYDYLGMIIGEKIEDSIVDEIFSKFCTGK